MNLHSFLLDHLTREAAALWGINDTAFLDRVANDWLDTTGRSGAQYRLDNIRALHPGSRRILDMGAGCGTFVRYALQHGFDARGIEPEPWKLEVARRFLQEGGNNPDWAGRMVAAVGEHLPFADATFDCVATFQTLEHVQDVAACCVEMVRVTRPGGCIHIRCPDYSLSTYEGHYRLPWLPGLWGAVAERYLAACGKPVAGLRTLQPVSARKLRRIFGEIGKKQGVALRVIDIDRRKARALLRLPEGPVGALATLPLVPMQFLRFLFRVDYPVHLGVVVGGNR
jgi:SAM-dependent methyltransferase